MTLSLHGQIRFHVIFCHLRSSLLPQILNRVSFTLYCITNKEFQTQISLFIYEYVKYSNH